MNRKLKVSLSAVGSTTFAVLLLAQTQFANGDEFCANATAITFDASLPVSHPTNRCASDKPVSDVSWTKWFSGRSPSFQFHYLDLLELLSRTTDKPTDNDGAN